MDEVPAFIDLAVALGTERRQRAIRRLALAKIAKRRGQSLAQLALA